mmetsp:Transcript_9300/g.14012  ORF Transcript_9300/g.14012 Transcript_9300/m.14012 type:complete len:586 (-) Transcript_9300:208-1965(-)|eukprot:CAMPEP_0185033814 /NCGR_PEP_ID=MMETSP1103-20130426/23163_1 /TAXON_ID=36769 /ORGANISM="Paraphysomonas bandaiensis, Strain Caron Lab Isolate" /LENGTH=585 /DNA_ID=CAMNT_0027570227 /DNA_START=38 /DNA_END=1795 /DNA_ORIENTATION=-
MNKIDVAAEIEKRKMRDKLDNYRIFTSVTNEARLETLSRIQKFKEEHKSQFTSDAKPKYLSDLEHDSSIVRELEDILHRAIPSDQSLNSYTKTMHASASAPNFREKSHLKKNNSEGTRKRIKKRSESKILAPIEQRYGNITETWHKGPVDIPKDRYFDLNDKRIYGSCRDPRGRQLKQQTMCLMNSMQMMSRHARINDTCRKRVVAASQEAGEDHVMGSLDQYVSSDSTGEPGQGTAILEAALSRVRFYRRKARRKPNSRIDECWTVLGAPPSSKIGFKLLAEASDRSSLLSNVPSQAGADMEWGTSGTIISQLETLCDMAHAIDLLHVLLKLWRDMDLSQMFASNELLHPLTDLLRAIGVKRAAKKSGTEMSDWLQRVLDKTWSLCQQQIFNWKMLCSKNPDPHFLQFFNKIEETLYNMVNCIAIDEAKAQAEEEDRKRKEEEEEEKARQIEEEDRLAFENMSMWSSINIHTGEVMSGDGSLMAMRERRKSGLLNENDASTLAESSKEDNTTRDTDDDSDGPTLRELEQQQKLMSNPRFKKSTKAIQRLCPITEVLDITQLARYHCQKPNKALQSRLEEIRQNN